MRPLATLGGLIVDREASLGNFLFLKEIWLTLWRSSDGTAQRQRLEPLCVK